MDEQAVGIQEHQTFKLGLRPCDPHVPALLLGDFLTGIVPKHPEAVDYLAGLQYGNYMNDKFGVCGPVSVANCRRMVTAKLKGVMEVPSQEDVFDLYRRSGNPNFNPQTGDDDKGVNMQVMLNALMRGGIGGKKPLGFAKVSPANLEELQAAVAIFGFLLLGVDLQQAQQAQTNQGFWDYKPSGQWGGHAIMGGAYISTPDDLHVITWGKRVKMTQAFMTRQLFEAWAVVWPEHLGDRAFLEGVDVWAFKDAWEGLTKKKFPAELPPKPPDPAPTPSPANGPLGQILIDPIGKRITYPVGWTATQSGPNRGDFKLI